MRATQVAGAMPRVAGATPRVAGATRVAGTMQVVGAM
jgi:hypothetical protein